MKLGTAKCLITPCYPVRLAGYASRKATFERVSEDIFLRVHIHRTKTAQVIFVYGDLIWWDIKLVENARKALFTEYGILPETLVFVASHSHSGPPTGNSFISALETYHKKYTNFLLQKVLLCVGEALNNFTDVTIHRFDGASELNVFRRTRLNGKIEMCPNESVLADHNLTMLSFVDSKGKIKGLVIHYACHANISGENCIQPDYPGISLRMLDEIYPESISLFLQGCTADLRPALFENNHFLQGDYNIAKQFAQQFVEACKKTLQSSNKEVKPLLQVKTEIISLPVLQNFTQSEFTKALISTDEIIRQWAHCVQSKGFPSEEKLQLKYVDYGIGLSLYFFSAEMSQYYAEFARKIDSNALCVAYTDGMIGYICTKKQILEGGYESDQSARYFAICGKYSPEIEEIIQQKMVQIKEKTTC